MAQKPTQAPAAAGSFSVQSRPQQSGREDGASFADVLGAGAPDASRPVDAGRPAVPVTSPDEAPARATAADASPAQPTAPAVAGPADGHAPDEPAADDLRADAAAIGSRTTTGPVPDTAWTPALAGSASGTVGTSAGMPASAAAQAPGAGSPGAAPQPTGASEGFPQADASAAVRALLASRAGASPVGTTAPAATAPASTDPCALQAAAAESVAAGALDALAVVAGSTSPAEAAPDESSASEPTPEDEAGAALSMLAALLQPSVRPPTAPTSPAASPDAAAPAAAPADASRSSLLADLARQALAGNLDSTALPMAADAGVPPGDATTLVDPTAATATAAAALLDLRATPALRHAAAVTLPLHSPVGTQAWADEVGASVRWMTEGGLQAASLRLNPDSLGPVEVRLSVQDGQTNVYFTAPHADTRAALADALPRLRDMLASQGLSLGDTSVSHQAPREQPRGSSAATPRVGSLTRDESGVNSVTRRGLGLVDLYA